VAASSAAWGWLEFDLTIPKAFGFEAATQSLMTTYKFVLNNLLRFFHRSFQTPSVQLL